MTVLTARWLFRFGLPPTGEDTNVDDGSEGLLALERPLRTGAPPWWRRVALPATLAYFGVLFALAAIRGDLSSAFPVVGMTGGLIGLFGSIDLKPFEMDGQGIRGGDTQDRLTWPYVERVDMADVSMWRPYARVIGRYGNEVRVHAQLTAEGFDEHPATLVRQEAEARDIEVRGTRPIAPLYLRASGVLAYLMAGVGLVMIVSGD